MTKQEKIIVSAYTGTLMCDFSDVHEYIEKKLGRPVFTHEMADNLVLEEIHQKIKDDFIAICENKSDDSVEEAIKAVSNMDSQSRVSQSVYVIEECSELIKELTKQQRGKGSEKDILAEASDVLTSVFVLLTQYGVTEDFVKSQILYKCNRALERYRRNGEV